MDIAERVKNLIERTIEEHGYILDNVAYEKEGSINFLRIIIDKQGIITVEDCVEVSGLVNPILDEADLIEDNYILDVCSKEKGSE
ncbi:MAG: hypothetical protein V8Q75_00500 [Bacilli bacterium]